MGWLLHLGFRGKPQNSRGQRTCANNTTMASIPHLAEQDLSDINCTIDCRLLCKCAWIGLVMADLLSSADDSTCVIDQALC